MDDKILEDLLADIVPVEADLSAIEPEIAEPVLVDVPSLQEKTDIIVPEAELSSEQKEIRMLRDQLARKQAKDLDNIKDVEIIAPDEGDIIHIHFVGDKCTALGRQWYRGQQIRFEIGSQAYKDTQDRYGFSWLDMTDAQQEARWGAIQFKRGPWPGKDYEDEAASIAEKARKMAAPILPRFVMAGDK